MTQRVVLVSWLVWNSMLNIIGSIAIFVWVFGEQKLSTLGDAAYFLIFAATAVVLVISVKMPLYLARIVANQELALKGQEPIAVLNLGRRIVGK
jgi:hypothetical protein